MRRIAHLTDIHLDDRLAIAHSVDTRGHLRAVLADITRRSITEAVLTGDLGEPETIDWLFAALSEAGIDCRVILGNHDDPADYRNRPALRPFFHGEGCYWADAGDGFLKLYLDSREGFIGPEQFDWISARCAGADRPLLIFIHHPVLDCGNTTMDRLFPLEGRDALRDLFLSVPQPVTIVCGHYHAAHETRLGNITQYVTPSTYLQLKKHGEFLEMDGVAFGYRLLELEDGFLHTATVQLADGLAQAQGMPQNPG